MKLFVLISKFKPYIVNISKIYPTLQISSDSRVISGRYSLIRIIKPLYSSPLGTQHHLANKLGSFGRHIAKSLEVK
jgi:hypothetical protein